MKNINLAKLFVLLALVLSILVPIAASAQNVAQSNAPFTVNKDDYFLTVLLKGFLGDVVDSGATGADTVVSAPGNLGDIFRTFNFGVAFFGTLMVTFITVVGVLQSGNDGEFLGRRWSSMWVPVRFATGSALMLPLSSSGYSMVQAMVLWIVLQGVSFTDSIWNTVVDTLVNRSSAQVWGTIDGAAIARRVALAEVCSAAVRQETSGGDSSLPQVNPVMYPANKDTATAEGNARVKTIQYITRWGERSLVPTWLDVNYKNSRVCGQMSLKVVVSEDDMYGIARQVIAEQHVRSIANLADKFRPLAEAYVAAFNNTDLRNPDELVKRHNELVGKIQVYGDKYRDEVAEIADAEIQKATNRAQVGDELNSGSTNNMKKYGFVTAGMYYIDMTRAHGAVRQAVTSVPEYAYPEVDSQDLYGRNENLKQILKSYESASVTVPSSPNAETSVSKGGKAVVTAPIDMGEDLFASAGSAPDGGGMMSKLMSNVGGGLIRFMFGVGNSNTGTDGGVWFSNGGISNNTSSIMQLKNKGDNILDMTGVLLTGYVAASAGAEASVAGFSEAKLLGVVGKTASAAIMGMLKAAMPLVYAVVFALLGFGFTLAIYLPMLPYMLWIGGVTGYLILIAEALVASSLWAVMLMHPSGEGMTSQHAERGAMLLLGLFTRPALMLMGLVMGMFMVEPLVTMINDTFYYAMRSVQGNTVSLLFSIFGFCSIYVALLITAVNKCFALIHLLPDKVLRWIGGGGEQLGETEVEQQARGSVVGVVGGFSSAAQAGGRAKEQRAMQKNTPPPPGPEGAKL